MIRSEDVGQVGLSQNSLSNNAGYEMYAKVAISSLFRTADSPPVLTDGMIIIIIIISVSIFSGDHILHCHQGHESKRIF